MLPKESLWPQKIARDRSDVRVTASVCLVIDQLPKSKVSFPDVFPTKHVREVNMICTPLNSERTPCCCPKWHPQSLHTDIDQLSLKLNSSTSESLFCRVFKAAV